MSDSKDSSAFLSALKGFKDGLDHSERETFKLVNYEDLVREIDHLQRRFLQQRRGRNLARLRPFLEAMAQIGKVVEVFANSSEFVGFVWVYGLLLDVLTSVADHL